jgi:hypothetical protein
MTVRGELSERFRRRFAPVPFLGYGQAQSDVAENLEIVAAAAADAGTFGTESGS